MSDEPENLVLHLLRKIDAKTDALDAKVDIEFAAIKDTLRQHGIRLDAAGDNFEDIGDWLKQIRGLLKDYAIAQELRKITRDLEKRVAVLENRRQ